MARAPLNVHVIPYRLNGDHIEYALVRRPNSDIWQGITGGAEDDETPFEAARREVFEECAIPPECDFLRLDGLAMIPVYFFHNTEHWGDDVYLIPQYAFGVNAGGHEFVLNEELEEVRWLPYDQAYALLHYDNNRYDLWELNQRLLGRGPRG